MSSSDQDGEMLPVIPDPIRLSRSVSCSAAELAATSSSSLHRRCRFGSIAATTTPPLKIAYEDESLCFRSSENAHCLFAVATSSPAADTASSCNSRLLARKTLSYRNLLERVQQADLSDPAFDVADFCGITWQKRAKSVTPSS